MNHEVVSRRPLRVIVHGAAGRMGQRVVALSMDDPDIQLIAAVDHADHDAIGHDIGVISGGQSCGVMLTSQFPDQIEQASDESPPIVIDFSLPSAIDDCIEHCRTNGWPLVVATTGLEDGQKQHLRDASRAIPIVWAPSMSPAVNVSMKVVQQITAALRNVAGGLDIEVIERHHRFKADAPSGTALRFG
ncbi:MAG: 4-hydroxy-tetrahydrodipicolinate reductase, partial [Planctomycetota bacterium]